MTEVKILIQGYIKETKNVDYVTCTTALIIDNDVKIIVDPGMHKKKLINALKKEGLKTDDIDYVVLTHNHIDHFLLAGIFENAKVSDGECFYSFDGKITKHGNTIPNTNIKIISTPGHDTFHYSLIAKTKEGIVGIVSDLWWWTDDEEQKTDYKSLINKKDIYVTNKKELVKSRKKILKLADYIIPGHGKMFEVKK